MIYEEFVSTVQQSLKSRLGNQVLITIQKVPKNNGIILDGLCITQPGQQAAPTIYMNSFYDHWLSGIPLSHILEEIEHIYTEEATILSIDPDILTDFEFLKDRVVYRLIHTDSNKDLLDDLPHIPFLDLSITFYLYLEEREYGHMTATIHLNHMKSWGITKTELYQFAQRNTPRLLPAELKSMGEVIRDLCLAETDDFFTRQL